LSLPAIAEKDEYIAVDDFVFTRLQWEVLHPKRFDSETLEKLRKNMNNSTFECQYQQNPISKESQEFHTEWFKYVDTQDVPLGGRVFTTVDPAWTKQTYSDYTSIITGKFIDDKLYILKYTAWKFDPAEGIDEIIKHIKLYNPEKIGVEAIQAKNVLSAPLNNTCKTMGIYANIEEIQQKGDKESRIRKLIPLFREWLVYFTRWLEDWQEVSLEKQLLHFPRGKHDDVIDSLQMLFDMYTLQPNIESRRHRPIKVSYFNGKPVLTK
jgi:predicted phage terminase large subunit-like protein